MIEYCRVCGADVEMTDGELIILDDDEAIMCDKCLDKLAEKKE